jgi:hypothetical protein
METPILAKAGVLPIAGAARGGDYSATEFDPAAPSNFWSANEYQFDSSGSNFHWGTQIVEFSLGTPGGPFVNAQTPSGTASPAVTTMQVSFSVPVQVTGPHGFDPTTNPGVISSLTGPSFSILSVTPVSPVGGFATTFTITFGGTGLTATGVYGFHIGPNIEDAAGNMMDQNQNGIPGEPTDFYLATLNIDGPRVTSITPTGNVLGPIPSETVTFSRAMDATTITGQVTVVGPGGPVSFTLSPTSGSSTTFTITFTPPLTAFGTYTTTIGPNVKDTFGNSMDQNGNFIPGEPGVAPAGDQFQSTFTIFNPAAVGPDGFGYIANQVPPVAFQELLGDPAAFTIINFADDLSVTVNLGSNKFNFYGKFYTGNNQLFVSSNGMISFGSADARFSNTNLTDNSEPLFAPLWADWIKTSGTPMVLGKFDAVNNKLIIEWNQVSQFSFGGSYTFEAILSLNTTDTNTAPFSVVYKSFSADLPFSHTVGTKDSGPQPADLSGFKLLVEFNARTTFVMQGMSLTWTAPPFGGTITGNVYNDLNHNGIQNPGEPPLGGWTVYQDLNNNGVFDPGEPSAVSDASGNYTIHDALPGTFVVREVLQPGWVRSQPQPGSGGPNPFTNGSFETGTFSGWSTLGNDTIRTSSFGIPPPDGTYQALVDNGASFNEAAVESFAGLAPGSLAGLISPATPTVGSALKQTITVSAGDTISFSWDFLTNEVPGDTFFRDFSYVAITPTGSGGTLVNLADTLSSLSAAPGSTGYANHTGYHLFVYTFQTGGTFTITVGAMNAGDTVVNSGLLVDNFRTGRLDDGYAINLPPRGTSSGNVFGNYTVTPNPIVDNRDFGFSTVGGGWNTLPGGYNGDYASHGPLGGGNLVVNGGFETGNFSGWTVVDPSGGTVVGNQSIYPGYPPHSGNWEALLGAVGLDGTVTQTVPTVAGDSYSFSFWEASDGRTPSDLSAKVNGVTVFSVTNEAAHGYVLRTFTFTATGATTTIQFAGRNDPGFYSIDDVSVVDLAPPVVATANWFVAPPGGPGAYELFATWVAAPGNATNVRYNVYDGATLLTTVTVNQRLAANQALVGGVYWLRLGTFTTTTGVFLISIDNSTANGNISADAVFAAPVPMEHIVNGGFETGDFTGWTVNDPTDETFVDSGNPHSGTFSAFFGAIGTDGTITQTIATVPGNHYTFSFWFLSDGATPNDFSASFGGVTVFSVTNDPSHGYVQHTFDVVATGTSTVVQFAGRNDPGFLQLDDVSVTGAFTAGPAVANGFVAAPAGPTGGDDLGGDGSGTTGDGSGSSDRGSLRQASLVLGGGQSGNGATKTVSAPSSTTSASASGLTVLDQAFSGGQSGDRSAFLTWNGSVLRRSPLGGFVGDPLTGQMVDSLLEELVPTV